MIIYWFSYAGFWSTLFRQWARYIINQNTNNTNYWNYTNYSNIWSSSDEKYDEYKFDKDKEFCEWDVSKKFVCSVSGYFLSPCFFDEGIVNDYKSEIELYPLNQYSQVSVNWYNSLVKKYNLSQKSYNDCLKRECKSTYDYCQDFNCWNKYPGTIYRASDKMCVCINWWNFNKSSNRCVTDDEARTEETKNKKIQQEKECKNNFPWTAYSSYYDKCLCSYDNDWTSSRNKDTKSCPMNDKYCKYIYWNYFEYNWSNACWCIKWYTFISKTNTCKSWDEILVDKIIYYIRPLLLILILVLSFYYYITQLYERLDIYKNIVIFENQLWKTIFVNGVSLKIPLRLIVWTKLRKIWLWELSKYWKRRWNLYFVVKNILK